MWLSKEEELTRFKELHPVNQFLETSGDFIIELNNS
jgi:hypothetical protein